MPDNFRYLFLADHHYGTHGGRAVAEALGTRFSIELWEGNYAERLVEESLERFDCLVTTAIGETCEAPHAPESVSGKVQTWLARGVPVILLHGGSATFWQWAWWRALVGLRWVRGNDPDGVAPSTHPIAPYPLTEVKARHPLSARMTPFNVPEDEIYTELEETRPLTRLLECEHGGKSHPMAWCCGGDGRPPVFGYLPGHKPAVVTHPQNLKNIETLFQAARGE